MDYLKEAENELNDYNDLLSSLDNLRDELKIIEYELKSVKAVNYENIPGGNSINGDDRIANLIFKKQIKTDAYRLTFAKINHINKVLRVLDQNEEGACIDAELLKLMYHDRARGEDICTKLNLSERTLRRRKHLALRRFARQLLGLKVD